MKEQKPVIMKMLLCLISLLTIANNIKAQGLLFDYEPAPLNSGFRMEGYWVWGGSLIKVDSVYHLFASRWPKISEFPDGYRNHSEIVHATANEPMGPYQFEKVVIGERDSCFWDANMAHNPTIHKIGDEYVLFYIGSDFTTKRPGSEALLRRVGYATAKSINGPWKRADQPLFEQESNNPALLADDHHVLLVFRDEKLQVFLATANSFRGPFTIQNKNVWPDAKIEDFYLAQSNKGYHMICEDNVGGISGHERWGVQLYSKNGISDWQKGIPAVVYNHDIAYERDSMFHCLRRERPQLFIEENKISCLLTSVLGEETSWCQPVKLKVPVKLFQK